MAPGAERRGFAGYSSTRLSARAVKSAQRKGLMECVFVCVFWIQACRRIALCILNHEESLLSRLDLSRFVLLFSIHFYIIYLQSHCNPHNNTSSGVDGVYFKLRHFAN